MENNVANAIPTTVPTGDTAASGTPTSSSGGRRSELTAGSKVNPVSRVVKVIPSWAPERWVEVMRNALIVFPSPCSPRAWRASRSWRSRFTRANSEATKNPVPTVRARPTPTINQSNHKVHRPSGRAT
jgi:hypothetical protein